MNTEIGDYYAGLQDEELLLVAGDRNSLSDEAKFAIDAEMAKRGLNPRRAGVVKRTMDRFRAGEKARTESLIFRKRRKFKFRGSELNPGWSLIPTGAIAVAYALLVPKEYKIPDAWEEPALVALMTTCMLPFIYHPRWKNLLFWIAAVPMVAIQLWMAHDWLSYSRSWGSTRSGGKLIWTATLLVGLAVFHFALRMLRRWLNAEPAAESDLGEE